MPPSRFGLTVTSQPNWQHGCTSRHTQKTAWEMLNSCSPLTYRELQMSSLCLKKASQQDAPYFITLLMTCALSCATKWTWKKLFLKAVEGKRPPVSHQTSPQFWTQLSQLKVGRAKPKWRFGQTLYTQMDEASPLPGTWAMGICCWRRWEAHVSPALAQLRFSCPATLNDQSSAVNHGDPGVQQSGEFQTSELGITRTSVSVAIRNLNWDLVYACTNESRWSFLSRPSLCTVCGSLAVAVVSTWTLVG